MKWRIRSKQKRRILLTLLEVSASKLDESLFGQKGNKYTARVRAKYSHELTTILRCNNNIIVEIREKENGHNRPHFHITIRGAGDASYAIDTLERIVGEIDSKVEKKILQWAAENKKLLKTEWESFHGSTISVT